MKNEIEFIKKKMEEAKSIKDNYEHKKLNGLLTTQEDHFRHRIATGEFKMYQSVYNKIASKQSKYYYAQTEVLSLLNSYTGMRPDLLLSEIADIMGIEYLEDEEEWAINDKK